MFQAAISMEVCFWVQHTNNITRGCILFKHALSMCHFWVKCGIRFFYFSEDFFLISISILYLMSTHIVWWILSSFEGCGCVLVRKWFNLLLYYVDSVWCVYSKILSMFDNFFLISQPQQLRFQCHLKLLCFKGWDYSLRIENASFILK